MERQVKKLRVPLYREVQSLTRQLSKPGEQYNRGLWYDKFFCFWKNNRWEVEEGGGSGERGGKFEWVQAAAARPAGDRRLLEEAVSRTVTLVSSLGGEFCCMATAWRLATGLGRDHPVENGMAWHHTLGVPYLPGSSVKGAVRSFAKNWAGAPSDDIERIFGPANDDKKAGENGGGAGSVIFFDALPLRPLKLATDVMTPHYAPYYQQDRPEKPPGDWYDPVPIPFLTVGPDQVFVFSVAPRRPGDEQGLADCRRAAGWLVEALTFTGAGAKGAAGYGRFVRRPKEENKVRDLIRPHIRSQGAPGIDDEVVQSPLQQEMEEDGYSQDPERFMAAMKGKWLARLEDEAADPKAKQEIAALLRDWYLKNRPDQWEKPNKKNKEKIAVIKKFLPQDR